MSDSPTARLLAAYSLRVGDAVRLEHNVTDLKGAPVTTTGTLRDAIAAVARDGDGKVVPGFTRLDALVLDVPATSTAAASRTVVPWHAVTRFTWTSPAAARAPRHPAL